MPTPIGIWTAAELLAGTVTQAKEEPKGISGQAAPLLAAFKFLTLAAAKGDCAVWGRRAYNGVWERISAEMWISLELDPIASKSNNEEHEYSEAQAHPKKVGPDYEKHVWNDLRWDRDEIDALASDFAAWCAASAIEAETNERSGAMHEAVARRLFAEPFWPPHRVLSWIAFLDPTRIEASWKAAKMHPTLTPSPLKEKDPSGALLRALQYDNIRAIKNGNDLPREAWAGKTGRDWPAVYFRREEVLALCRIHGSMMLYNSPSWKSLAAGESSPENQTKK